MAKKHDISFVELFTNGIKWDLMKRPFRFWRGFFERIFYVVAEDGSIIKYRAGC